MLIPRFRKRFASRTEDQSTVSRRRTAQLTATAILVAAFLTAPRDASGQPAESAINGSATLEVFDPIDANGNSEGLLLHVPHTLYRQLSEAQSPTFGQEPSWILRHATYTGVLEPKTDPSRMQLSTITADFELNVYHLGGAIRFPLAGQAVTALKREAFLDGRRFELQWEAARSTIALPIRQTGRHHLQLSFQTVTEIEAGVAHVRLPIPVTPQAKLFLTSPQDLQLLQVPSAGGGVQRLESQGQLSADLGPTDHLHIQWPTPTTTNLAPAIEHLGWLRLQRDEARYDIQIVPDMTRLKESAIVLEVDERLQLDTASNEDRLSLVPVAERGVRGLRFDLTDIDQGSSVIRLSFVVTSATGIGRIRLPRCRVLNHDVPLLLGVSADPRLGLRVTPDNATLLATDDFMLRWGGSLSPEFAYELPSSGSRWTCQGQWIESVPRVDVREAQIVDRGGTRVVLVATINANAQKLYQQELSVPEAFVIENIQALSTSHSSLIRWFRHPNNRLTILLDDPSSDRLQIAIVGYCPDSELDSRVLPRITFPGTIMERRQVDLFRTSDVLVRGLAIDQLPPPPDLAPFIRNQVGLARWQQRNEDPTQDDWTISLKANDRQLSARMYNVVSREQGEWHHRVRAEYQMDKGVLDSLTFEIPEAWAAAMMEEPGLRHYYSQAARLGTVRVTLWQHPRPFDRGSALEFSGKIQTQPGQPLTVPNIRLLNEGHIERQLYLPIRLDGQPILWSTTGMQPLDNAEPPATLKQAGAEYEAFAISDAPFQAVRLPVRTAHGVPALTLTDVHIAWQSPSDYQGMALMDLDPNGLDECLLHVPSQLTVVAIYVDQTPVTPRASDQSTLRTGKRYRFQLASNELPQRIRVMFSGKSSDDPAASSQSVMSPTLYHQGAHQPDTDVEIPADVTLWTVYQTGTGTMDLKGELATVSQLDKLRLVHFSDVMDQAASLATDFSPDDLARWYSVWGRRFLTATGRMQIHSRAAAGKDDAMSEAVLHARERHVEVATQLKVDAVYQQLQLDEGLGDSTGVWLDALAPTKPPSHQAFEGNKSQLTVVYHPPSPTSQYFRWIAALLIGLAVLATQRWPLTPIPFN